MGDTTVVHTHRADDLLLEAYQKLSRAKTIYRKAGRDWRVSDIDRAMSDLEDSVMLITDRRMSDAD